MSDSSIAELVAIERQLDKLASTCNSLIMLSNLASAAGNTAEATELLNMVPNLQLQQFLLFREKQKIVISSPEWKAMKAKLEKVNTKIEADLKHLNDISEVINQTSKVIAAAAAVVALF